MPDPPPAPLCSSFLGPDWIDDGTMCRSRSPTPRPLGLAESIGLTLIRLAVLPAESNIPARDLTQTQARDLVVYYVLNHQLDLEKPLAFGKDGKPTFPKVGEKVKLGLDIGGVHFTPDSAAAAKWTRTGPMDMRMAVLAVRLAQYLRSSRWEVTTIFWGGMGVGRAANDRHGKGFALDFHGALTGYGKLDVAQDWGNQKITLPNGKTAKQWPSGTAPYFRLDVDTNAGGFFYDVYHFLTGEAADAAKPSSIGDNSYILHPDHPDSGLRPSHQDHIHCEIDR
jgi:hypothetical protein